VTVTTKEAETPFQNQQSETIPAGEGCPSCSTSDIGFYILPSGGKIDKSQFQQL
jgi:hypothetical protein